MTGQALQSVHVNGRQYRWPDRPLVVVCIDGSEPSYPGDDHHHDGGYIERAINAGRMPFTAKMLDKGTQRLANCVIPAFNGLFLHHTIPEEDPHEPDEITFRRHACTGDIPWRPCPGRAARGTPRTLRRRPFLIEKRQSDIFFNGKLGDEVEALEDEADVVSPQ